MRWIRLLLLLVLLVPTAAMAAPCCDEESAAAAAADCCGPAGDCPEAPSGECALTAGTAPTLPVVAQSLDTPQSIRIAAEQLPILVQTKSPPAASGHGRTLPPDLAFSTLRN